MEAIAEKPHRQVHEPQQHPRREAARQGQLVAPPGAAALKVSPGSYEAEMLPGRVAAVLGGEGIGGTATTHPAVASPAAEVTRNRFGW
jgi:hypothetical protein